MEVTAQHRSGAEGRAQLEEVRRRWEAKLWKRQITLRDLALEGEQRSRAAAAGRRD